MLIFGSPAIQEVAESLRSGWLGTGPKVARFESDFAAYKGVSARNTAAPNSCTEHRGAKRGRRLHHLP